MGDAKRSIAERRAKDEAKEDRRIAREAKKKGLIPEPSRLRSPTSPTPRTPSPSTIAWLDRDIEANNQLFREGLDHIFYFDTVRDR